MMVCFPLTYFIQILLKGKRSLSDDPDPADDAPSSPGPLPRRSMTDPGYLTAKQRESLSLPTGFAAGEESGARRVSRASMSRSAKRKSRAVRRVHPDFESLFLYFQGMHVHAFDRTQHGLYDIGSFKESKLQRMTASAEQVEQCVRFNERNVSRVYPDNIRMNSSNFDPMPMWAAGCQLVALNYQTLDRHTFLNDACFRQNGGSLRL
jgi:hypothetical protein